MRGKKISGICTAIQVQGAYNSPSSLFVCLFVVCLLFVCLFVVCCVCVCMQLVESMRTEGVLRSLGSQPTAGWKEREGLPASGNVLEMEAWQPRSHTSVLRRHGGKFPTTAPSQRYTTAEALGSLPPPEESAQTLVVKAGAEGEGKRRRRSSVSDFLRRKLSRSGSGLFGRKDGA